MQTKSLFLTVFGLLVGTMLIIPAIAGTSPDKVCEKGTINSSYTAEKEVSPDTAEVSIAVKTEDTHSLSSAITKNKEISEKVYANLKGMIDNSKGDYLKTSNFSANPSYRYTGGKQIFEKYEVSNNIIVHTKNIEKISAMIDKSLKLGATNVDSLSFSLSEKDNICANLLKEAAQKSKNRADLVASASGTSVTGIKSLDTSCTVNRYGSSRNMYVSNRMMYAETAMDNAAAGASTPDIEAGVIKVYATVGASYFIK